MDRRDFLKSTAASAATLALGLPLGRGDEVIARPGKMPRRVYGRRGGREGVELSIIGFGGIVVKDAEPEHAARVVAEAVEKGINYFDVAPSYGDAEAKLGPALQPYRKDAFLACKTTQRKAGPAREEFDRSLQRLRTDYFDLYQLHAITDVAKDVDAAFAPDGVMTMVEEERKAGRIRHVGFSAHSVEAALAAMERYDFDSVLWPVNFTAFFEGNFGPQVIARAQEQGASVLALKAMARQKWPADLSRESPQRRAVSKCWYEPLTDRAEAELALRFTLSQPVTAAVPPGEEKLWRLATELAMDYRPITADEIERVRAMAQGLSPIFTAA